MWKYFAAGRILSARIKSFPAWTFGLTGRRFRYRHERFKDSADNANACFLASDVRFFSTCTVLIKQSNYA